MAGPEKDQEIIYWLTLAMTPGVGPYIFKQLLETFGSPEAVLKASPRDLKQAPRIPRGVIESISRIGDLSEAENELGKVRRAGFRLITSQDDDYPPRLGEIHDPPPILWTDGDILKEDNAAVAIVGSRAATEYGRKMSAKLARELAETGITVVSGVAMGIDAAAHAGALAANGRTIGVLGCGLDIIYPRVNKNLYRQIPGAGALLSEFPLGSEPNRGRFPRRNRIISGLSAAVVVVEAGSRSGAAITARLALEQDRDVLAVPGRAGAEQSKGAHLLLRQGAKLVENGRDILEEILPQLEGFKLRKEVPDGRLPLLSDLKKESEQVNTADMNGEESLIWELLGRETHHIDMLGRALGWPQPKLTAALLNMELKGLVKQLPGMRYTRN